MMYNAKQDVQAVVARQCRMLPIDVMFRKTKYLYKRRWIDDCLPEVSLKKNTL